MTRFWWVRHGPTHASAMVGWTDLPADLGDAARLARLDAHLPRGAWLISSDLLRATATADALARGRRRLPHDRDLREIHFGDWEMQRHDQVSARDPDLIRAYWDRPGDVRPPNGESWNQVRARVDAATDRLLDRGAGDMIVVAHLGAILTQVQRSHGLTATRAFGHRIDTLSVTRIDWNGGWRGGAINHCP